MAPTSNFQRLIPSGRDNESRLELAYQRVLLNHEKNERLLLKRIEQLESNQKNLIIERNMLRTKLCKQSGEMADLNWRVTHYEIYSYRNNKRQCMIDRDSWALTSKKRVWDFLSSHGIPYKVHNNRGTRRDSLSMSETGSCVAPAAMQPGPSNPDRLMGGISGGYSTSSRPTQRDITDISSISKGHGNFGSKRRDSVQTIQTTEMADFANTGPDDQTGLLACALEIAREMSSYRCYIRSSLRDFFGKYEPHNGKIEINKNHEKMRILQSEIPRREDESTIGTLEIGVKAISLTRDQELAQSEAGNRQGAVSLEFEDMDSIARPPPHLVNMDAKVGLVRALETYGNMLGTFCRTCNSMQALVTDLKSISGLIKASQKENDKLRESLDKVVSSKEVISAAPEDLVILLNSILRYPQWHNEAALSIDDCVAYPGDNNLISGEIQNLRKELSDKECEKSKSSQALENLESQFEEVSRINEELSENCTYFEKMATTLKAKHDEELKSKQDIIENLELRCESISQTNEASNGRINALMEDLSTRKVEVEKLKAKVIDLEKRNCTLETDCSDMKTAIDKKDRTLYVLTAENMSVIGVSAEKEASLNRMLVEHKARIHEISTEKLKLENDHARCNITIEELGRTISRKDDVIDRLDEEKKKAYCDIDSLNLSLQQSTESWGKKLAESVKTITKLETESSKLREKVSDLTKVVEVTDAKIQDTTRAHETTLDRLSGTVMENQTLCKKIECLQNELATKSKDLLDSGHKTEVLNELVGKMGKSIADLRVKNKDLEDNLSTKIDSLQNELTIISKDLSDSEHKNKLLKAHNGEIERFVVDLQNKNKDLENNLLVKDQVVRDMEGRYTKLDRSLSLKSNEFKEREEGLLRDIENIKNMYRDSNNTITRLRSDYESLTSINEIYKTDIQNAKRVICYLLAQYKLCIMAKLILQSFLENIGKKNEQLSEVLSILKSNISTTKDSVNSTLPMILNLNSSMDNVTERLAGTEILLDKKDRVNAAAKFIAAKTLLKFASMSESVSTLKNLITDMDTKYKDKFSRLTSDRDLTLRESADAAAHAENEIINLKQKIGELQSQKFELESLIVKIGNEKEREILDCEDRARQLSNRLAEASGQIARLSDQLSSSDSCLKHIKESEDVLRAELELTKNEKVEMCQRLSDDNARFKLHCTELTREISVISEKLQKKQVEYTDIQNELAEIKNASSVVANDLNEIQDKYTSLESSHSQLLQKYASLSESLSKITREKMDIDSTLINANNKLAESAECNARMNKEINELKKKNIDQRDYYETRLAEISEKLNYTARNLENSENKIVLVSNEISTKNTQHKKKIEDLESEICRIKDAAQNNHIIISKKLVQTESSLILAESKIKELSTDNESLASSIKLEREKLNVCENILKKYGYDIGSKVFDLKSELKAKNELVEKLSKDVEDLNAKLEHFRSFNYSENPSLKDYGADELSRLRGEVASLRFEKHRSVFEIGQTMMQYRERIAELERKLTECSTRGHSPFNTTSHA